MLRLVFGIALVASCLLRSGAAAERVWTDTQGRTMRAEFLREVDGEGVFLKDGKLITVPLDRFAEADREVMKRIAHGKAEPDAAGPENPFRPVEPRPQIPQNGGIANGPLVARAKTAIVSREWSDVAGNRTTGRFVRIVGREVLIIRGARTLTVSFDKLSFGDQTYVNQILEDRGQAPLAPLEGRTNDGNFAAGDSQVAGPQASDNGSAETGPLAPGESQFFRELRERQDEARQQQAEFAAENPTVGDAPDASGPESTDIAEPEQNFAAESAPAKKPRKVSTTTLIKAETLSELRPVLIVALVVIGLFGAVGIIVYVATSVAASNSARRQRRYL